MPYRYFRRLDTGNLCKGVVGSEGPFGVNLATHRQNWADAHGLLLDQIEGFEVEALEEVPDLSNATDPIPVPPDPIEVEKQTAREIKLPTFAEIDTLVDTIFPGLTDPQRTFLKRLAKLVRALYG